MMRPSRLVALVFVGLTLGIIQPSRADDAKDAENGFPEWVWHVRERQPDQEARFTRSFIVDQPVTSAWLTVCGESAEVKLSIDGRDICDLEPYDPVTRIDLTDFIATGKHRMEVTARSVDGPCAWFLDLQIGVVDGQRVRVVSDVSWETVSHKGVAGAVTFGHVDERFVIPRDRQIGVKATDNYEQWKQALGMDQGTDPASFWIADDFQVQVVRAATAEEDSWVSMAFDRKGRVIIAKESKGLLQMTLADDGNSVVSTELINDTLKECRGILPVGRHLYVNANNSKALYRLSGNRHDTYDEPGLIVASSGGVGHGRNDLALGRDGKIYSIHGDAVDLPLNATDYTSPMRHASARKGNEGHLLRVDPETQTVELLATGLRNPFGIDFNEQGDVFTYDADAEYDMGSPWYRPTRVSHLVTGGDYGWRAVTKSWPPYYPDHIDNTRPNLDIGKGSPTAVKFGTRSNFPRRFQEALFILDWAYGRIIAVHPIGRGASYVLTAETFLKGRPLNVTDLDFAPDGSMYFVTGGRKTLSALYRVQYVGSAKRNARESQQRKARGEFASRSRALRRELEDKLLDDPLVVPIEGFWQHLSNSDPWIVQAAVNLLERQPIDRWQDRALSEPAVAPAVRSLLSLAHSGKKEVHDAVVQRLNQLPINTCSRSDKQRALQAYSLCSCGKPEFAAVALQKLERLYPDQSFDVNRLLTELLVRLNSNAMVQKTVRLLNDATDQREQMHYLYVLRNVKSGWTAGGRTAYFRALAEAKRYQGGAGMPDFLKTIKDEAVKTLTDEEREQLASLIDESSNQDQVPTQPREFVRKWTVDAAMSLEKREEATDLIRGKELFQAAACGKCHRIAGHGTLIGPDLTNVSSRFSRRDLLTSIIDPSDVIAENYRSLQIVTADGRVLVGQTGLGGDYRSPILRLATDPMRPLHTVEIPKTEIESQRHSPISWMPEGLLDTLTGDEIVDLLGYIQRGGR